MGISVSKIDGNGQQFIVACVECRMATINGKSLGRCAGKKVVCLNYHDKNNFVIYEDNGVSLNYMKRGKEETLCEKEFENFLIQKGYKICDCKEFCKM